MEQTKKMPLEGIRVVELATVVAAPTASRVLCAFGAEAVSYTHLTLPTILLV